MRQNRLLETLDFDTLDVRIARARTAAAGDEVLLKRIARAVRHGYRPLHRQKAHQPSVGTDRGRVGRVPQAR